MILYLELLTFSSNFCVICYSVKGEATVRSFFMHRTFLQLYLKTRCGVVLNIFFIYFIIIYSYYNPMLSFDSLMVEKFNIYIYSIPLAVKLIINNELLTKGSPAVDRALRGRKF